MLLFFGGTSSDIIDITVYIEIIDRRSRIKFLKRMRCDRGAILHCQCIAARYSRYGYRFCSSPFTGIRNWAGIPRYELIPLCRSWQRSYRCKDPRDDFL